MGTAKCASVQTSSTLRQCCFRPSIWNRSCFFATSKYVSWQRIFNLRCCLTAMSFLLRMFQVLDIKNMVTKGPESEAICLNCQHNTEGDRCEQCDSGFFRIGDSTRDGCRPYVCVWLLPILARRVVFVMKCRSFKTDANVMVTATFAFQPTARTVIVRTTQRQIRNVTRRQVRIWCSLAGSYRWGFYFH